MTSIKHLIVLTFILTTSFGQEEYSPPQVKVSPKIGRVITDLPSRGPLRLEKKITLPLNELMDRKQECPRLQELSSKLLNDPNLCDIEIEVHDQRINESRVFYAHRAILCLSSEVLTRGSRN